MRKKEFTNFTQIAQLLFGRKKTPTRVFLGAICLFLLGFQQNLTAQCALVCNDDVNVSLPGTNENCAVEITPDMVLEDPPNCANPLIVVIMDQSGDVIPNSPIVDETYIGQTLVYSVQEDIPGGNSCWGTMDIEDKLGPNIANCDDYNTFCLLGTTPTLEGGNAPSPNFSDCTNFVNWSYLDAVQDGSCNPNNTSSSTPYTEIVTRTWTAIDAEANVSNCTQTITVLRVGLDNFTPSCPTQVDFVCTPNGAPDTSPSNTGYPTINLNGSIVPIIPGSVNSCSINSTFQDEVLAVCGGGEKILRTWSIYDWCLPTQPGINPIACIQQILIEDELAPTLTCPTSIFTSAVSSTCAATVVLPPAASAADECSDFDIKINTPFGQITGNGGVLPSVPVGMYDLTYIATDECNNSSNCMVTLTVEDTTPPVVVCDEFTTVSLADSVAVVAAVIFDDGSQDNCEIDYYEVRRMASPCGAQTPFGPFVEFDCCDVNENVMISLRVFDIYGNSNSCMIEVEVQDKIDPTIICPADKTIACADPIPDIQDPIVEDNCNVTFTVVENDQVSNCGVGLITRTYTATDDEGLTASCVQTVTVENNDPFDINDIIWPEDYLTFECGATFEPTDLDAPFDFPITNETVCDLIAVTHTDQELPVNPPACTKVLRTWVVIDWCQYNPNVPNSPGYWQHVQILRNEDVEAPVITCPTDITVDSFDPDCMDDFVTVSSVTATDCSDNFNFFYTVDLFSNGSTDENGVGPNVSGNYPFGTHQVEYLVEDMCGNSTPCEFSIIVRDKKLPTPVCYNGLAVELMPDPDGDGGMIQIAAELLNSGSFDNCTADTELQFVLSPNVFTCADVGTNIVTLTVVDEFGNSDFCETYILVQDNMFMCPGDPNMVSAGGFIGTEANEGVDEVIVEISGNGQNMQPVDTDNGMYEFVDIPMSMDYTFSPTNNADPDNGVTTFDLAKIKKHILGTDLLDSPYKIIAADANQSNSVTTLDMVHIRKLILQVNNEFPSSNSWRFVDAGFVFPNPQNPFETPFPEFYNINDLDSDNMNINFIGIKIGDVNGSADPQNLLGADDRNDFDGELSFHITDRGLKSGETYRVDFETNDFLNIFGYQFTLDFDETALELVDIIPGELENLSEKNFGLTMLDEGIITSSWDNAKNTLLNDGTILFSLTFTANTNTTLSNLLKITSEFTQAEAYQAVQNDGFKMLSVKLEFTEGEGSHDGFVVYQNRPNPFSDQTTIGWEMPEAGWAKLTIVDFSGRVIKTIRDDYPMGYNELVLQKEELGSNQMLFYRLENACEIVTKKMIMVD